MKPSEQYQIKSQDIELDKLVSLRLEALRTNPESFGEKFEDAAKRTIEDWRFWFLQRHNEVNKIFVVQKNIQYIGMCGLFFEETKTLKPYLWGIYINPGERNQGLGRELLTEVIESVKNSPASTLSLRVEKENKKALSFYQALAFKEFSSRSQQTEMKIKFE